MSAPQKCPQTLSKNDAVPVRVSGNNQQLLALLAKLQELQGHILGDQPEQHHTMPLTLKDAAMHINRSVSFYN